MKSKLLPFLSGATGWTRDDVSALVFMLGDEGGLCLVNRDGDTGIQDFLTLLGGWGPCR